MNIGVTLDTATDLLPFNEALAIVKNIETLGYESVWLTDTFGREPFVLVTALLANTEKIRIGTAVASMYGRDALAAAQTRQTLSEMYPDRFMMGMGTSAPFANEARKAQLMSPAQKVEEYLNDIQSYQVMCATAESIAPLYVAAHGPKIQALTAEKADGILTWVMPSEHTELTRSRVGDTPDISCHVPFTLIENVEEARQFTRQYLSVWKQLPWYQQSWVAAGFDTADLDDGGSDRLIDAIVASGNIDAIASHVGAYAQAGASRVILQPLRRITEGEALEAFHQTDMAADWEALELVSKRLGL